MTDKLVNNHLRVHIEIIILIYLISIISSYKILILPEPQTNLVTLLATGAIIATFGSAIGAISHVWQSDLLERVKINIEILYHDIFKQKSPWKRWPFLSRSTKNILLDKSTQITTLRNPEIPLDIGTHQINIDLPTVLEDFFDLPVISNFWPLFRFRKAAHTRISNKPKNDANPSTNLTRENEYMAYECMYDIWKTVCIFRLSRYFLHFGSSLIISSVTLVALFSGK